ncbi:MAG TPA: hypothetical protein PLL06_19650 [Acidobacteriota bacterium]|nr:hypothetical protein [Acidobacteriota bacterium]
MNQSVMLVLDHPHGKLEISLEAWMRFGPGERTFLRPMAARCALTGKSRSFNVVPFRYRNTWLSRMALALSICSNPWSTIKPKSSDSLF